MTPYDPKEIEKKWQEKWEKDKLYEASSDSKKPKYYCLVEFPYPSGEGLHVGHPRPYIGLDIVARKRRMEGFNVLYPMGWDAFGLPAENYAIKTGRNPAEITKENIAVFKNQMKIMGLSFDWSREVNTTDPKYYKWTQWIFLQFLKHGLAYKKKMAINWCPKDKIGLANEEVVDGKCERCGTPVEKREKEQWMLAITKYAERLDKDLDTVDYLPQIKLQQRNWIGRSEGAEINFELNFKKNPADNEKRGPNGEKAQIPVFTTRPDTIFGATYLVLAPEHLWVQLATDDNHDVLENKEEVKKYIENIKNKTEIERGDQNKEKTGVEIKGVKAINTATKEEIPMWIADYVLPHYGTGAIMAVPADDKRDEEFAQKYNLPIIEDYKKAGFEDFGKKITTFKLRDWIFSRQRYWGEPIPVIHCDICGIVPVPEADLPVKLPDVKNYEPTDTGESPLAGITEWVNVKCPNCKGNAKRETDTMPNWAGSSWYFLRYTDPANDKEFAGKDALKYWTPVDWYNGGMEHTTLHLLYSRFWNKFLFDLGLVPTSEPYKKRTSHGFILGVGGEKMSKSRGNVINPDDVVEKMGADTLRLYEMFIGPFDQAAAWSTDGIVGPRRFLEKIWRLKEKVNPNMSSNKKIDSLLHRTIKKVEEDIERTGFNTAVSALMVCANEMEKEKDISKEDFEIFLKILAPFAPHITEELWAELDNKNSIHEEKWPEFEESKIEEESMTIVVQVNGKVRASFEAERGETEENLKMKALALSEIEKWVKGMSIGKVIYVKGKLVNIVI